MFLPAAERRVGQVGPANPVSLHGLCGRLPDPSLVPFLGGKDEDLLGTHERVAACLSQPGPETIGSEFTFDLGNADTSSTSSSSGSSRSNISGIDSLDTPELRTCSSAAGLGKWLNIMQPLYATALTAPGCCPSDGVPAIDPKFQQAGVVLDDTPGEQQPLDWLAGPPLLGRGLSTELLLATAATTSAVPLVSSFDWKH